MEKEVPTLAIVVGGTPVPGLNTLVACSAQYSLQQGWKTIAFHDGYVHLATGDPKEVEKNMVVIDEHTFDHYHRAEGSLIRCDTFDPTRYPRMIQNVVKMLTHFKVNYLLLMGGNDKCVSTHIITRGVDPATMKVLVIPKTIDNDIMLPYQVSTFGFHSARCFGKILVKNFIQDAHAVPRWFILEVCGKTTGHLALSLALSGGAHCTVIPEDFGGRQIEIDDILDIIEGAIYKRLAIGKNYGVCIVSEGVISHMSARSQQILFADGFITYAQDGRINLDEADLARALRFGMEQRMKAKKIKIRFNTQKLGHELRGADPIAHDEVVAKELAVGAVQGFKDGNSNSMVVWENGRIHMWSFRDIMDSSNHIPVRYVNTKGEEYISSRKFMFMITSDDLKSKEIMQGLAKVAKSDLEEFIARFAKVVKKTVY